jgi:transposase
MMIKKISELRPAFVFLVKERGKSRREIAKFFGVRRETVNEALRRHDATGNNKNRRGQGRKRTATNMAHVEEVREILNRNNRTRRKQGVPASSTRRIGRRVQISRESARQILKRDLGLKPYKDIQRQKLTPQQRKKRLDRAIKLRERCST